MGFFSFLKKDDSTNLEARKEADLELLAPATGTLVPLNEVPDLVISEKLIGDGVAIVPSEAKIVAPCAGVISRLIVSNNAFAVRTELGVEVYVTFGIGTNSFSGIGLSSKVSIGQSVTAGETVILIDMEKVSEYLESTVTSMIVVNSSAPIARVISTSGKVLAGQTPCTWVILEDEQESN